MAPIDAEQFKGIIADLKGKSIPNLKITDLNGFDNYYDWKFLIKGQLICFDFFQFIESDFADAVKESAEFKKFDRITMSLVTNNVCSEIRRELFNCETAKQVWKKIVDRFEGTNQIKTLRNFRDLMNLMYRRSNDLQVIVSGYSNFVDNMSSVFPENDKNMWNSLLFAMLPDQYSYLSSILRTKSDITHDECIEFVNGELQLDKERSRSNGVSKSKTFVSNCNSTIYKPADKRQFKNFEHNQTNKNALFCRYCKNSGHNLKNCPKLKEKEDKKKKGASNAPVQQNPISSLNNVRSEHSNYVQSSNEAHLNTFTINNCCLKTVKVGSVNNSMDKDKWYFDTGAEGHVANNLIGCIDLKETDNIFVNNAHGGKSKAIGIGTFKLTSDNNEELLIKDVIVDLTLEASYISGGVLDKLGLWYVGGERKVRIYSNEWKLLVTGNQISSTLYQLNLFNNVKINALNNLHSSLIDWHRKLGHLNIYDLKRLLNFYNIKYTESPNFVCEFCLMAKCSIKPFYSQYIKTTDILQIIHSDLSGIIRINNVLNVSYFAVFIDDYSRVNFIYLLKRKSDLYDTFVAFKNWIELKTGKRIKVLRSDNGTEYCNEQFNSLSNSSGLELQYSIPRRQQQNGVSERAMRTITNCARSMLFQSNMSSRFWPFAVTTAVYLRNRSPCSVINYEIPFMKFFKIKPSINHLLTFGASVVIKKDDCANKFDSKGIKGRMVGYGESHKGYNIYVPELNKVIISRDVYVIDDNGSTIDDQENNCDFELTYSDLNNEIDDFTNYIDTSVKVYSDGTINHLIKDILPTIHNEDTTDNYIQQIDQINQHEEANVSSNSDYSNNGHVQQIDHPEANNVSLNSQEENQIDNLSDQSYEIVFNKTEKAKFIKNNPNATIKFVRPTKSKGNSKCGVYKIMNISINKVSSVCVPNSLNDALHGPDAEHWALAALEEMNCLMNNKTWTLVPKPNHKVKFVPGMFILSVKHGADLSIDKYKVRYVAKGCALDIEDSDNFAPVLRGSSFRMIISIAVNFGLKLFQLDVKTAFLNSDLDEDIYMKQPDNFVDHEYPEYVCKLNKSLYGLRQSAKNWFNFISKILIKLEFRQLKSDSCIFISNDLDLIIGIYVDDFIVASKNSSKFTEFKNNLSKYVQLTDKGLMTYCLGINVCQINSKILINQSSSIKSLLKDLNLEQCNGVRTPMQEKIDLYECDIEFEDKTFYRRIIGALLHIAINSRPDICFSVSRLCGFVASPMLIHMEAAKRIVRYLKGTVDYSLKFVKGESSISSYADADWGNDPINSKSVSGNLVYLFNNLIHWQSKRQPYVALHTCEAELLSVRESVTFVVYLRYIIQEMNIQSILDLPSKVFTDNESTKFTIDNGGQFSRNKHYLIRSNFIKDYVIKKQVQIINKPGREMFADGLTKPLGATLFQKFVNILNFEVVDLVKIGADVRNNSN